jgi:superfamily II DNA or RNA helicase
MIRIQVTPLSYRISVSAKGQLNGTQIYLEPYLRRFNQNVWDHRIKRMILYKRYVYYCRKTQMLYLPRYDFDSFCRFLGTQGMHQGFHFIVEEVPLQYGKDVDVKLLPHVKDKNERQTNAILHLTNCDEPLRGLSLGTGLGKTYCTIRTLVNLRKRSMIAVAGLVDQWERSLRDFTDLKSDDIYIIQGAPSLMKLLSQIDRNIHPKVILCSMGTMRNYVLDGDTYENCPPFDEVLDHLKVGVRVVDEGHLNFWLSLMMDLRTNAAINIVLSATFDRTEKQVKIIFNNHYPQSMRYGEDQYDRHIDVFSYSYTLGGMLIPQKAYTTPQGYNHSKLEDYLLRRVPTKLDYIYDRVYLPMVHAHYINVRSPGQKMLVLCSTVDMCNWFKKRLIEDLRTFGTFDIETYVSESEDEILDRCDIIVSTEKSAGTGTDIKKLKFVLMTIAVGSDVVNKQTLGRLRVLPDEEAPIYGYAWCRDIQAHQNYQDTRRHTFTQRGKSFTEVTLG